MGRAELARLFLVPHGLINFARRAGRPEAGVLNAKRREDLFADQVFPRLTGARLGDSASNDEAEIGICEVTDFGSWRYRQIFSRDRLALRLHSIRRPNH